MLKTPTPAPKELSDRWIASIKSISLPLAGIVEHCHLEQDPIGFSLWAPPGLRPILVNRWPTLQDRWATLDPPGPIRLRP